MALHPRRFEIALAEFAGPVRGQRFKYLWIVQRQVLAGLLAEPPHAPKGTEMPFVPKLQYSAIGRYEFESTRFPGYVQAALAYTDDSWSNLETSLRQKQADYTIVNLATGIHGEQWTVDLFIDNATNERAQIVRYGVGYYDPFDAITQDSATVTNRPRTIGLRCGHRF